jgi:hypothetical protein
MIYRKQLSPWALYQHLPECRRVLVQRFRRRSEAEECLKVLQRKQPDADFKIVFENDRAVMSRVALSTNLRNLTQSGAWEEQDKPLSKF